MAKSSSEANFSAILDAVGVNPDGISVRDLLVVLQPAPPKRTLQFRLRRLVEKGRLVAQGNGSARKYLLPKPLPETLGVPPEGQALEVSDCIHDLGTVALEIQDLVNRPLSRRTPVGYQPQFLLDYQPNRTAWLSPEIRNELAEIGQVGMAGVPAGTYLRQVLDRLLIDLSWNSSRLEGNTYSLLETLRLLEHGEVAKGKAAHEAQMLLNHKVAIEMLAEQAVNLDFNRYTLCNLHAALADNLLPEPAAGGRVRSRPVGISGSVFHPLEGHHEIGKVLDELLDKICQIENPFEQAFFAMVQLPYLQPFEDVNKRVSRLAANIPLIRHNLCPLSFIDVPQGDYIQALLGVYELNRVDYLREVFVWAYRRSASRYSAVRQSLGDPDLFRLRFRQQIRQHVREVVERGLDKGNAAQYLAQSAAQEIDSGSRARFVEVVEIELLSLHEGNIARYQLVPEVFRRWQECWR
jgi:Fic family protein